MRPWKRPRARTPRSSPPPSSALSRWPDYAAAEELLRIASTHEEPGARSARRSRATSASSAGRDTPAAKKLAAYEKLLALPGEDDDKKPVLAGIAARPRARVAAAPRPIPRRPGPARRGRGGASSTSPRGSRPRSAGSPATRRTRSSGASKPPSPIPPRRSGPGRSSSSACGRAASCRSSTAALSTAGRASSPTRPRGRR